MKTGFKKKQYIIAKVGQIDTNIDKNYINRIDK